MATPQKPIPAPIDRFKEKMAIEAKACRHISYSLVLRTHRLSCMSNWHFKDIKTQCDTMGFCALKTGRTQDIAIVIAFACLPPKARISMICHHRICSRFNLPSLTTGQALLNMIDTSIEKDAGVFCYLKTNRQCHLPMLDAGKFNYHVYTSLLWWDYKL